MILFLWVCTQNWYSWVIHQLFYSLMRNLYIDFFGGCANLHIHEQHIGVAYAFILKHFPHFLYQFFVFSPALFATLSLIELLFFWPFIPWILVTSLSFLISQCLPLFSVLLESFEKVIACVNIMKSFLCFFLSVSEFWFILKSLTHCTLNFVHASLPPQFLIFSQEVRLYTQIL